MDELGPVMSGFVLDPSVLGDPVGFCALGGRRSHTRLLYSVSEPVHVPSRKDLAQPNSEAPPSSQPHVALI
jgi:hypothetical protein